MRFVRFNVVGAIGIAVQLLTVWILVHVAGLSVALATAAAVTVAVLHNFVWHVRWTWKDRAPGGAALTGALARFALTNGAISMAGNVAITAALAETTALPAVAANLIAITICGVLNYAAANLVVFSAASLPDRCA